MTRSEPEPRAVKSAGVLNTAPIGPAPRPNQCLTRADSFSRRFNKAMSQAEKRFEELVRDHARVMAAAIRRVCGRRYRSLVADVEQEVYLALWKRLQGGNEITYPVSYLYKMALTTALAVIRKLEREAPLLAEDPPPSVPESAAFGDLLPVERSRLLDQVLAQLDADQARAMRGYLAGFNHKEVASLYGWSESVARHRIYRGIERLKARMREEPQP